MANLISFTLVFILLVIIPLWFLDFTNSLNLVTRLVATAVLGVAVWYSIEYGGAKRGFVTK